MKRRILLIEIGPKLFLTGILPASALGTAYSANVSARGGTAPYQYRVIAGALPGGWALEPFSGAIAGTTDTAGLYTFTIEAIDARGATTSKSFSVRVQAEPMRLTGTYPDGTAGVAYSADLSITGGTPPYANPRAVTGELPPGLELSIVGNNLRLSGMPSGVFEGSFAVEIEDALGGVATSSQSLQIIARTMCTFDPALIEYGTLSEDLLTAYITNLWDAAQATDPITTGKVYWEIKILTGSSYNYALGVRDVDTSRTFGQFSNGYKRWTTASGSITWSPYGKSFAVGDIVMFAYDAEAGKMWIGKNGAWFSGDPAAGTSPAFDSTYGLVPGNTVFANNFVTPGTMNITANFGGTPFHYTPPAEFLGYGQ